MKDLEEEMGQTLKKMMKDIEKERRKAEERMKDTAQDLRREMGVAEDRILQFAKSVAQRHRSGGSRAFEQYEAP
eukprot:5467517-Karenia_brevis.AAC.1